MSEVKKQANTKAKAGAEQTAVPPAASVPPAQKPAKAEVVRIPVKMSDGSVVEFTGKSKLRKTAVEVDGRFTGEVRFDFVNGYTRTVRPHPSLAAQLQAHGVSQKGGDSIASADTIENAILAFDETADNLEAGRWGAERKAGDSFAGSHIVLQAVVEASGRDLDWVKNWIKGKLEDAKARGVELTRQDIYKGFKKPGTRTAAIIERLEREALTKDAKIDGEDMLAEIGA